jgi:hypothetical protein
MESGDGRWIHARGTQADEDAGPLAWPSTGASAGKRWGRGGIPGFSGWMAAAVAVVAAAAGVVIGFLLVKSW